ncbi:hypothetical protein K438DRAFT_1641978 [Mycena galopus ATCC 62051]|nr:hypothetical protein K438DRAFT_1641978 [Mycena galopus ATCC 62051]
MLQQEINVIRTRAQARAALASREQDEPEHTISPKTTAPTPAPAAPVPPVAPTAATPAAASASVPPVAKPPQHPFSNARDAAYAPPKDRNVGLPPAARSNGSGPAYRTSVPIYNPKDANDVFESCLNAPVTLTQRQIFSIAPDVWSQLRNATTLRRAPSKDDKNPASQLFHDVASPLPYPYHESVHPDSSIDHNISAATFSNFELPADAIVIPDPFAVYYDAGNIPEDLIVSMESSAIRSILPVIDNQQQVECIVDGGSQVIAMSEAVCHELALSYDPRIILRMQSANGSVSPLLGLARNVPFRIGDITLYLQVHIVRNPAYDVLLGRPFDVLTQSIIRNFANEDQTITICDPNTGKLATVPTVPRGPPRHRKQGFPNSRN